MDALHYRVHEDGADWRWEVLDEDERVLASGRRKGEHEAQADGIRTALHLSAVAVEVAREPARSR